MRGRLYFRQPPGNSALSGMQRPGDSLPASTDSSPMNVSLAQSAAKRLLDIAGSVAGLIVLAPILVAVCLWIKLDSPGPLLFRRRVTGRYGRHFTAFKFRSMVRDAHERLFTDPALLEEYSRNLKIAKDPRITRSGQWLRRTSLDELPQLINVLAGQMSLVGPRMLGDVELDRYGSDRGLVLQCKPGITGLWQVSGRQTTTFEVRRQLDITYVRKRNLWLDLKILARTLPVVISGHGAG